MRPSREQCRNNARECIELARIATEAKLKAALLRHAQQWMKQAYAAEDGKFRKLVDGFNNDMLMPSPSTMQNSVCSHLRAN